MTRKNQSFQDSNRGILRCARYAFMPNKLSLCGPNKQRDLFEYCETKQVDKGLSLILEDFQTLYPYLKFIARMNRIRDSFDEKVVEAYWIGNELLEGISRSRLYYHLADDLKLKKKLNKKSLDKLAYGVRSGAQPPHNFHVLGIWRRTGHLPIGHTLATMELCKVSWGRVKKINKIDLEVETSDLTLDKDKLGLGLSKIRKVLYKMDDKGFIEDLKIGDWISFHWGFACEVLNNGQVNQLKKYTKEAIDLVNLN